MGSNFSHLIWSRFIVEITISKVAILMPSFKCKDIRLDCPFEATAKTSAELMKMIVVHANKEHHMKSLPHDIMEKIKKAIKP